MRIAVELPESYRIDLLVEDLVIFEVKAVEKLAPIHEVLLLTYLRFASLATLRWMFFGSGYAGLVGA